MKIPYLVSFHNEMPVRIRRYQLDPIKQEEFNNDPQFKRDDYKYLWELDIDKGPGRTFIKLATPDFRQLLYSIRVLWRAKDGDPYDRHGHPVVMQAFDLNEVPMESIAQDEATRKKVVKRFRKSYAKNKGQ